MKQLFLALITSFLLFSSQIGFSQEMDLTKARAFYKGKTIIWMIGSTPGGAVDRFSRLVGPFLAKHVGTKIVLQNRPGGGGTFAFNYLYNKAKKDGLRLAFHIGSTQALNIISEQPGLRFNFEELSYIGVVSPINNTMMAYAKRFRTLEDLKRADNIRYGMTRPGGNVHFVGVVLKQILGLKLQFVSGYSGSSAVRQALLSGEIDVATYPASSYVSAMKEGIVVPILTGGSVRHPAAPDTPTIYEVIKNIPKPFDSWVDIGKVGWSLYAPPGVPKDRLQVLRGALKNALKDPELLKKAKKQQFLIKYLGPEEALQIVKNFLNMPKENRDELKRLLGRKRRR